MGAAGSQAAQIPGDDPTAVEMTGAAADDVPWQQAAAVETNAWTSSWRGSNSWHGGWQTGGWRRAASSPTTWDWEPEDGKGDHVPEWDGMSEPLNEVLPPAGGNL